MIGHSSLVTAHGQTMSVTEWGKQDECFVTSQALFYRLRSLHTDHPTVEQVEAALCFTQRMWIYYRRHGYITGDLIDDLKVAETTRIRNLDPFEMAGHIRALPARQRHVLLLQHRGHTTSAIAYTTKIGPPTVKRYFEYVLDHLGLMDFDDWRLSEPEVQQVFAEHLESLSAEG